MAGFLIVKIINNDY